MDPRQKTERERRRAQQLRDNLRKRRAGARHGSDVGEPKTGTGTPDPARDGAEQDPSADRD